LILEEAAIVHRPLTSASVDRVDAARARGQRLIQGEAKRRWPTAAIESAENPPLPNPGDGAGPEPPK
jgi:hypothetical protein